MVLFNGVSLFGQAPMLFYFLLGLIGSSAEFAKCAGAEHGQVQRVSGGDLVLDYQ
jgi:hypothetical protein